MKKNKIIKLIGIAVLATSAFVATTNINNQNTNIDAKAKTSSAKQGARQATGYKYYATASKLRKLSAPKTKNTLHYIDYADRTTDGPNQFWGTGSGVKQIVKNYRILHTNMKIKPGTHMYSKYVNDGSGDYNQVMLFKLSNGNTAVYDSTSPKHSYEMIDNPKDIYTNNTGHYVLYWTDIEWTVDKDGFIEETLPSGFKMLNDVFQGKFSFAFSPYDQTGSQDSLLAYHKGNILIGDKNVLKKQNIINKY